MTANAFFNITLFTLALFPVLRSERARGAREIAFYASAVATLVSLISLAFQGPGQWWHPFPALVACITLVATGMSRLGNTSPQSYATMLALAALSTSYVLLPVGWPMGIPWISAIVLVWLEVRKQNLKTARVFAVYLGVSSVLVFLGLLVPNSSVLLITVALALCIKEACFPFRSWFPSFVETTPMGVVVAFVTPQVGVFLHLKMLTGHLSQTVHMEAATLGVITALFGAALATVQTRLKRVLAYLFISQSGLVAFGLENSLPVGRAGALAAWLAMALGMAGLAMSIEALHARRGEVVSLLEPGRDFESTPGLATSFLLSGLAMVGLPGTLGFISEDLLVQGSVVEFPGLGFVLIIVTALNAMTIMRSLLRAFAGPKCEVAEDLVPRERVAMTVILASLFFLGLCPQILLHWFGS